MFILHVFFFCLFAFTMYNNRYRHIERRDWVVQYIGFNATDIDQSGCFYAWKSRTVVEVFFDLSLFFINMYNLIVILFYYKNWKSIHCILCLCRFFFFSISLSVFSFSFENDLQKNKNQNETFQPNIALSNGSMFSLSLKIFLYKSQVDYS